ncbi:sulfur carrier protein [Roseateles sp. YR242]|uniref:sulfur carrier protein ThiS n=1 Tax=Roseateles sp. YR242 TaxID=1855305 RepID=UPI0008C43605|nr:sulfur carrier protein ThiS [Roseateles sp. YR242]SEK68010.1 sulfur carrier protein [Roseateles sp. YR242]
MTPDFITVRLDDRPLQLPMGTSVRDLLDRESLAATAVATAVNGRFVPRAARASTPLADGDQVLLFQPIVGG